MSVLTRYNGLENLIDGATPGEGEPGAVGAGEVAIEEVRAEIAESITDIEQLGQAVEEIRAELEEHEEAVEELQEEITGAESLLAGGNFTAQGFAMSYNRALRLNEKLGGQSFARMGVESISDAATAKIASVAGIESFMATVKNAASKAAEFIKHIFNTVLNFFVGLFSAATGLDKRRAQLEDRLKKAESVKEKVKLGGWNVGVDYAKNGADILDKGPFTKVLSETIPAFIDIGKNLDGINASQFKSAYNALVASIKEVAKDNAGNPTEKGEGNKRNVLAARAGFHIFMTFADKTETDEEILAAARSIKLSFGKTEGAKEFSKGEEVASKADKAKLQGLLNTVGATVSVLRDSKVTQKFSKAERDRVVASLNVKTKENAESKEGNGKAIALVRALYSTGSSLTLSVNKLLVHQAKQAMDLVAAHL